KRGIRLLKGSSLVRYGNPLYALPWYVGLGTQGAGKTAAMQRARLASPIQETPILGQVKPTKTMEWWLFDRAVILDLSSRYVVNPADKGVQAEWKKFLGLLAGVRRKEPLNGVIVTIAADELLYSSRERMLERTRSLRIRIDQLMRLTDTRFPVYVVVTKCDMLYGMTEFSDHLPPETLRQALGYVHQSDTRYAREFLDNAFVNVAERLRDLRLVMTRDMEQVSAGLLLFPNEFERLKPALDEFFSAAFGEDPYMEAPMLRGLFFTSSQQGGGVSSFVLKDSNLPEQTSVLRIREKALFIGDLFSGVLAHDRNLHHPLNQALRWGRITRNLGLSCWVLACVLLAVVFTGSFVHSWNTVNDLRESYPAIPQVSGKFAQDLNALARQHSALNQLAARNDHWWVRWLPFNQPVRALQGRLAQAYAGAFNQFGVAAIDDRLARRLNPLAGNAATEPTDIQFVVRRLNLLRAEADGGPGANLESLPDPVPTNLALAKVHGEISPYDLAPDAAATYNVLYRAYLRRESQTAVLSQERSRLENWLNQLALSGGNMDWLVTWVDEQPGMRPVALADFWHGSRAAQDEIVVRAAFTQRGYIAIDKFLSEVERSLGNNNFSERRASFLTWYRGARLKQWQDFSQDFNRGKLTLASEAEWRALLPRLMGDAGPHIALLNRINDELRDTPDEQTPAWLKLARRWQGIKALGKADGFLGQAGRVTGVISNSGPQLLRDTVSGGVGEGKNLIQTQLNAGKAYATYAGEVSKAAAEASSGMGKAAGLASGLFQVSADPAAKDPAPLAVAFDALKELRGTLMEPAPEAEPTWRLIGGPLQLLSQYTQQQASCTLQNEWAKAVLFPLKAAPSPADAADMLYGQKGLLWAFTDNAAKGFLQKGASNFQPVESYGSSLPFTPEFLQFAGNALNRQQAMNIGIKRAEIDKEIAQNLSQSADLDTKKSQGDLAARGKDLEAQLAANRQAQDKLRAMPSNVTLNALPTHVNQDAKAFPFATILTLQCAPDPKTLTNYNFPATGAFTYMPNQCGDVSLQIKVENLSLMKVWTGPNALPQLLLDFYDGQKTFTPDDFPGQKAALDALNIKSISVRYQFSGHLQVLRQADELFDLKRRELAMADESKRIQGYNMGVDDKAYLEKKDTIKSKQEDLVAKEKQLGVEVLSGLRVPATAAECWTPSAEWLLAAPPQYNIPAPKVSKRVMTRAAPAPAPVPTAGGRYQIQIGIFGQPETERLAAKLKADGYAPEVVRLTGVRSHLYRVRIGSYASRAEAQAKLAEMDTRYNVVSAAVGREESDASGSPPAAMPGERRRHRRVSGLPMAGPMEVESMRPVAWPMAWPVPPVRRPAARPQAAPSAKPQAKSSATVASAAPVPRLTISGLDALSESLQRMGR
ncbi:MAG TPA: type VI secretion protein IcmF/TssM N-terminal domain-containing protein, partial [Burkholderiales bacterium]|nr:type VI secretion protein IcmF/TssM N-terminal domain-containing protein [Burkholderiales bacterium]